MKLKHLKHTDTLDFFAVDEDAFSSIPMFSDAVQAGFPSPAEDHMDMDLNLNENLLVNVSENLAKAPRLRILRLQNNRLSLNAIPESILSESKVRTAVEPNS